MEKSKKGKEEASSSNPSSNISQYVRKLPKNPTQGGSGDSQAKNNQVVSPVQQSEGRLPKERTPEESSDAQAKNKQVGPLVSSSSTRQGQITSQSTDRILVIVETHKIPQGMNIIRSMDASYCNIIYTGCVNGKSILWFRGKDVCSFQSSIDSGPVDAVALHDRTETFLCAFLAHRKGKLTALKKSVETAESKFLFVTNIQENCEYKKGRVLTDRVLCLCLSDDSSFIYSGAENGTLRTWRVVDYELVDAITRHRCPIRALAVGPGIVFSGGDEGVILMWKREPNGETPEKVTHSVVHTFRVKNHMDPAHMSSLQFERVSRVGGWLYAGSSDGRVRCWKKMDLRTLKVNEDEPEILIQDYRGQQKRAGKITCLALSSGCYVFSGSTDGTICVWKRGSTLTNEPHSLVKVLQAHTSAVVCIAVQNAWHVSVREKRANEWVLYSCSDADGMKIWSVKEQGVEEETTESGGARGSGAVRGSGGARVSGAGRISGGARGSGAGTGSGAGSGSGGARGSGAGRGSGGAMGSGAGRGSGGARSSGAGTGSGGARGSGAGTGSGAGSGSGGARGSGAGRISGGERGSGGARGSGAGKGSGAGSGSGAGRGSGGAGTGSGGTRGSKAGRGSGLPTIPEDELLE